MQNNKRKKRIVLILIYAILFLGLLLNLPARTAYEGVNDFDWYSNDIMISDMMYAENYNVDNLFLYTVVPGTICPDDPMKAQGVHEEMFRKNEYFSQEKYDQYTSNIVSQRYFYRFLVKNLPISHDMILKLIYVINCALAALMLTLIFSWILSFAEEWMGILCALVLVVGCPYFMMYGKNMYWSMWSLFLPIAAMCIAVKGGSLFSEVSVLRKNITLFLVSFITCFIKMTFYFEFVTSVMIGMTIPLFYYCFKERYNLRKIIGTIIWPFFGALLSFAIVFYIKILMLMSQYGESKAFELINTNLGMRLLGSVDIGIEYMNPVKVSLVMLAKEFMSIKGIFKITFCAAVGICIFLVLVNIAAKKKYAFDKEYNALLYTVLISVLAPLSWFVLAAPHTTIHNQHATITWYLPFGILFIILIEKTIKNIFVRIRK